MEVLRDTVLDICRELFSNHNRPSVRVKCHIEVYAGVSQIFCTSFEDVLCTDMSSEEFEETVDVRAIAGCCGDVSCKPETYLPCAKSVDKYDISYHSDDVTRWLDSNSNKKSKCFESKVLDEDWVSRKIIHGDANAQNMKFNLQYCSTGSFSSISKNAPQSLKQFTSLMDGRACKKRASLCNNTSVELMSSSNKEVFQSEINQDDTSKISPDSLLSKVRKASDFGKSNDKVSELHSDSSETIEIVAIDEYFPSEAGSSVDQGEVDIYAADSIENEAIRHTCVTPLHCSECLMMSQLNATRSSIPESATSRFESAETDSNSDEKLCISKEGDAWHLNLVQNETMSSDDRAKKFSCSQCDCSFSMLTNLRRHVKKMHHNNARLPPKCDLTPFSKPLPLPAQIETKVVVVKSDLTKRSGRYRHVCKVCDAVFTFRTNLTRHAKKTHGHVPVQDLCEQTKQ